MKLAIIGLFAAALALAAIGGFLLGFTIGSLTTPAVLVIPPKAPSAVGPADHLYIERKEVML